MFKTDDDEKQEVRLHDRPDRTIIDDATDRSVNLTSQPLNAQIGINGIVISGNLYSFDNYMCL